MPGSTRTIFLGLLAGLISTPILLLLSYLIGIVLTAIKTREVLTTLLVAGSFLPLMILLVLLAPTLILSLLTGLAIGIAGRLSRNLAPVIGLISGAVFGEVILTGILPMVVVPQPGDFTSIVSNPFVSGLYGIVLGVIASMLFLRMSRRG
jgi:hypothetical protein